MNRITITPESEDHWRQLRAQDLTSTDVAALFGLSPYKTAFELWHEKKAGEVVRLAENERMKWGKRLESAVAEGIASDMGWAIRPMKEYVRVPESRIGSSFDFRILDPAGSMDSTGSSDALLEIKTVDFLAFRDGWTIEDEFIEAPAHIELQVQHQMLVSGLKRAYIGVLVGGNRIEVIERLADEEVHRAILGKVREFWCSIDANTPPPPVMPDDAEAVIRLHQYAEPGKLLDARGDADLASLLQEYQRLGTECRKLEDERKVLKATLLERIGDAEKVLADGYTISAGIVGPTEVSYTREAYRNFRVTPKKAAKQEAA